MLLLVPPQASAHTVLSPQPVLTGQRGLRTPVAAPAVIEGGGHGVWPDDAPDWSADYYTNTSLAEPLAYSTRVPAVYFDWGTATPAPGVPADAFSARWQTSVRLASGIYRFYLRVDDGARLWVDDNLLMGYWSDPQSVSAMADIMLAGGDHSLRLEYYEATGEARIQLNWIMLAAPTRTKAPTTTPTATPTAPPVALPSVTATASAVSLPDTKLTGTPTETATATPTETATATPAETSTPTAPPTGTAPAMFRLFLPLIVWE